MVNAVIALATEDRLSEEVGIRLALEAGLTVEQTLRQGGSGYLRNRTKAFCEMSRQRPVFVITDLDREKCPVTMIKSWFGVLRRPPELLFRIAVSEIESWVMADHRALGGLFQLSGDKIPREPDTLPDPKSTLISLARRAPRAIREDIVPAERAIASQGLNYNQRLTDFVQKRWKPERAADRSPSLRKTRDALRKLASK